MFALALVLLAQSGGWYEWRFFAGQGTHFGAYLSTCTDKSPAKSESVPGNVGWTRFRCTANTWTSSERQTNHTHGVRLRALLPNGSTACEVTAMVQPNLPPRVVAAVEALYPLQPPPASKVATGAYKIQVCRTEVVPPGGKPEDPQLEYCSAFGTLQVRPGADSVRCALTSH